MAQRVRTKPTERRGTHDQTIREHPAFGCVVVTRPQGERRSVELYGSRVPASSYISIAIHEAEEHRRLQGSQHMVGRYVTKIAMTEAQFATMIGAVGNGSGVPCTIEYRHTEGFAQMPAIEDFSLQEDRARHIREMTERDLADLRDAVRMLDALLAEPAPTKSKLRKVREKLIQAVDNAPSNYQFAADRVSEHLADTVAEVKMELHAYALATGAQLAQRVEPAPSGIEGDVDGE